MKSAFLSPKGPWLLALAVFVLFACLVAAQTTPSIAAWPYWPAVKLAAQGVVLVFLVLLVFHAVKVDVSIEPTTGSNMCNSLAANYAGGSLANSLQQHRQNLELQAIQTVVQAALLNGQRKAGEMARAAIDQLLGTGSLEYAKAALDESARTSASINQAFAAMQACTCKGNEACSNCPPQRFGSVNEPGKHKRLWRLEPHQERVVDEKDELDDRLRKLKAFIDTNPQFNDLPEIDKELMRAQLLNMGAYASVLEQRIQIFHDRLAKQ